MIDETQRIALCEHIEKQRAHHQFYVEAFSCRDSLYFELMFTSVMGVDRLFIKCYEMNGSVRAFECCSPEDSGEGADWIEKMADEYFGYSPYSLSLKKPE
jgi:hypothetical protein